MNISHLLRSQSNIYIFLHSLKQENIHVQFSKMLNISIYLSIKIYVLTSNLLLQSIRVLNHPIRLFEPKSDLPVVRLPAQK